MSTPANRSRRKSVPKKSYQGQSQARSVAATARRLRRAYARFKPPPAAPSRLESVRARALSDDLASPTTVAAFDWRTRIVITPAQQQGTCNACSSFAVAAAIEAIWMTANAGRPIALSPGFIHTCLGHQGDTDPDSICEGGVDLFAAVNLVQQNGYALSSPGDYPFAAAACSATPAAGHISGFEPISGSSDAKTRLVSDGPIVADLYIWQDFLDYTINRAPTYVPDMTRPGPYLHSVCVVGFDARGWIVKNSYGPDWGDGSGFANIAYGFCALIGAPPPPGGYAREAFAIQL
jgi:C1A family cysteine protease